MQFSVDRSAFAQGVETVQNVAETSLANPMIENILLEARDGRLTFTGTNLSVSVRCSFPADVKKPGEAAVPARFLANVTRELPAGVVDGKITGQKLTLTCAKAVLNIGALTADDFPSFSAEVEGEELTLPTEFVKQSLRRTLFATSSEEKRYELDGVKLEVTSSECRFVATDGRRMSLIKREMELPVESASALVPSKTLQEVNRIFPDESEVKIAIGERKIVLSSGDVTVASTLLNDNFPPYQQILPKEAKLFLVLPRRPFLESVRRVAVLSNEKTSLIRMSVDGEKMVLHGERQQVGDATDEIEIKYKGDSFEVGYQSHFLTDMLKVLETDEIQMELVDANTAAIFRPLNDKEFLHLVMPMRLERPVLEEELEEEEEPA